MGDDMKHERIEKGTIPECDRCSRPAIFYDPACGRHLCETHLCRDIEERVISTITSHHMINDGDRIAVGLSGGKDSSALLLLLSTIIPRIWNADLVAITVDEGIAGYREDTIRSAVSITKKLGIRHVIVSFPSKYGSSLDSILRSHPKKPCTVCGILRKKALSDVAKETGSNIIATGHNLDDAAQSILMNYLRGDLDRLVRNSSDDSERGFVRRIKPFMEIPEKEVTLYGIINGIVTRLPECPYAASSLRSEVRSMQAAIEYRYPGSALRLVHGQWSLAHEMKTIFKGSRMGHCSSCGDPCSGLLCQSCQLLADIDAINKKSFTGDVT
jgi:uncharacterized protein (TIGR00269 family)